MGNLNTLYKSLTESPYLKGSDARPIGRQKQYFAKESIAFIQSLGEYANNHYILRMWPWNSDEMQTVPCRIEDSFDEQANTKRGDDWKDVLFYDDVPFATIGLKVELAGCIWLGYNTRNIASLTSSVTIRRCDNVLNFVDEYGNITPEPFVFDKYTVLNSTNITKPSDPATLINGYKNAWIQYNERTATLKTNDRFIIQGQAFTVRGVDQYSRQITDEKNSVKMISFVLAKTEEVEGDDLENNIANADANVWEIKTDVQNITAAVGTNAQLGAEILHNGQHTDGYKILYESSDRNVVQVNASQNRYYILGEGTATVRCTFEKNPNVYTDVTFIGVEQAEDDFFITLNPETDVIKQYESVAITATLFNGTTAMPNAVTITASGVPESYYTLTQTDNTATIYCKAPYTKSKLTLTAIATENGEVYSVSKDILLASTF